MTMPVLADAGLKDAVVIVTGGGSGIGAATARRPGAADLADPGSPRRIVDACQVIDRE